MRVLVTGSSGFIGRALTARLAAEGHHPVALRRSGDVAVSGAPSWEAITQGTWEADIGHVDAVVHLAGENLAARRWTPEFKRLVRDSRIVGTAELCRHLSTLNRRPQVLIAASAVGYYGDRGDELLTEDSAAGSGFLAQLCREWEDACSPASAAGIRVVNLRLGMVLGRGGGALARLFPIFKAGLGSKLGSGRQWVSWISLDDLLGVIMRLLNAPALAWPINAVAPNPVTNKELTGTLGKALNRPTFLAAPAFALRLALGQMADEMLLASARVEARRLIEIGHRFKHPNLNTALKSITLAEN